MCNAHHVQAAQTANRGQNLGVDAQRAHTRHPFRKPTSHSAAWLPHSFLIRRAIIVPHERTILERAAAVRQAIVRRRGENRV